MKKLRLLLCAFFLFVSVSVAFPGEYVAGEIIVRLREDARHDALGALNRIFRAGKLLRISPLNALVLAVDDYEIERALAAYSEHPDVEYAEPNFIARAHAVFPDDPYFEQQWHLERIRMPKVWAEYRGSLDIIVSVVDSGVESSHPDLAGRLVPGYNFVHGNDNTDDDNGHGTYIAGIIGAETNNGIGVAGVSWDVTLMPVKALDSLGVGAFSDVAAAIVFSADSGADIINLSLGGRNRSLLLEDAVNYAHARGCVLVASTGNSNDGRVFYPAAFRHAIAVGGSNQDDLRADASDWGPGGGSNYGDEIDLVAPGSSIMSTFIGEGYASASGTSASAAVVSGASAVLLAAKPSLLPGEVRWLINSSADSPEEDWNRFTGHGRLNVLAAVGDIDIPPGRRLPGRWPFLKQPNEIFRWVNPPVGPEEGNF